MANIRVTIGYRRMAECAFTIEEALVGVQVEPTYYKIPIVCVDMERGTMTVRDRI